MVMVMVMVHLEEDFLVFNWRFIVEANDTVPSTRKHGM